MQDSVGKLGMGNCVMLLCGAMIGSAIFSLSGPTILVAGPGAILSWLAAGAIMLGYGLFMGELACRYPRSGGVYYFPRFAFPGAAGRWLGWLSCWSCILTNVVAIAFSGIYVGIYLGAAFPGAAQFQGLLAAGAILFSLGLNLLRVDLAGKINTLLVLALLLLMASFIGCAFFGGSYQASLLRPFFTQGTNGVAGVFAAIPTALIGYSGIMALAFMAADVADVRRTLPRAMVIAVLFVALVYMLMIAATLGLVDAAYLLRNPGMRFIPVLCACNTKLARFPLLAEAVCIAAVLALMTTMTVCLSINARAMQAAGEDGSLPRCFMRTDRRNVPVTAAVVTALFSLIYCGCPEYTQEIVNFGAVFNIITMLCTMLAVIRLRRTAGSGDFTVPGGNLLPYAELLILFGCNVTGLFQQGSAMWLYTAVFIVLGVLIRPGTGQYFSRS